MCLAWWRVGSGILTHQAIYRLGFPILSTGWTRSWFLLWEWGRGEAYAVLGCEEGVVQDGSRDGVEFLDRGSWIFSIFPILQLRDIDKTSNDRFFLGRRTIVN